MASAAEMTLALGWQGMRNRRLLLTTALLATASLVHAQEQPSDNEGLNNNQLSESPTSTSESNGEDLGDINNTQQNAASAPGAAAVGVRVNEGASPSPFDGSENNGASDVNNALEANEPSIAADDYRATERISEDRSVSFPVDI